MLASFGRHIGSRGAFFARGRMGFTAGGAVWWVPSLSAETNPRHATLAAAAAGPTTAHSADTTVFSRGFASTNGTRAREPRMNERDGGGASARRKGKADSDGPALREVFKRFVLRVHPDLFASGPAGTAEVNNDSLKVLQGLLDAVTKSKRIPNAGINRLKFFVRDDDAPEGVRVVQMKFKTTGGDCRNLVASQLKQLFEEVGVPPKFRWKEGDWENDPDAAINASTREDSAPSPPSSTNFQPEETETTAGGSEAGRGGVGRGRITQKRRKNLMGALKVNDQLFEAIAAVPWVPEPIGDDRVRAVINEIIPKLVKQGWKVDVSRGTDSAEWTAVDKIWRGERDESVVMDGVDVASGLALSAIIKHARNFDRELGKPVTERLNFNPEEPKAVEK